MNTNIENSNNIKDKKANKLSAWLNDPMGSVIAATTSVFASFAIVLAGIGMINIAV